MGCVGCSGGVGISGVTREIVWALGEHPEDRVQRCRDRAEHEEGQPHEEADDARHVARRSSGESAAARQRQVAPRPAAGQARGIWLQAARHVQSQLVLVHLEPTEGVVVRLALDAGKRRDVVDPPRVILVTAEPIACGRQNM